MVTCFSITNFCMLTDCIILSINRKPDVFAGSTFSLAIRLCLIEAGYGTGNPEFCNVQADGVVYEQGMEKKPRKIYK